MNVIPLTLLAILALAVSAACSSTGSPATDSQPVPVESQAPMPATATPAPGTSQATPETPTVSPATDSQPAPVESQASMPATATPGPVASQATPETPAVSPTPETPIAGSVSETTTGIQTEEPTEPPTLAPTPTTAPPITQVGTAVGDSAPEFALQLADGQQISSSELLATGRPAFMMYFATWWPTCRAELQTLSKIAPEFAGQVDFYLVAYTEDAATLDAYASGQRYTDVIAAQPVGRTLRDLEIVSQSSMIALDGAGVITYRKGYGGGSESTLRAQFEQLATR